MARLGRQPVAPGPRRPPSALCRDFGVRPVRRAPFAAAHDRMDPFSDPLMAAARHAPAGLRPWQAHALEELAAWEGGPFLISAAPAAGKPRPALELARALLRRKVVPRVAVVCPTTPLTRQWAAAAGRMGVHLVPDAVELRPPSDFQGVAVTYARAAASAKRWASQCGSQTLVIADEAHHLGEDLAW